jgi:hypothetical protein
MRLRTILLTVAAVALILALAIGVRRHRREAAARAEAAELLWKQDHEYRRPKPGE